MDVATILGQAGAIMALGLSLVGAAIGSALAGVASHGAMARMPEGHGPILALSALPSTQMIYGFVLLILMNGKLASAGAAAAGPTIFWVGIMTGLAICGAAIGQGMTAASGILASARKPTIFGKTILIVGIIEAFGLFAMVGGILTLGTIK